MSSELPPTAGRAEAPLDFLAPYFLGPAAENIELLESLITEFLRDHAYWRRNFHPEDGQRIRPRAQYDPRFLEVRARIRAELYALSADLKRAVPFFHPRYVGHMSADLLLPGLLAKLVTTLYNPNNVSEEAAPVTVEKELQVGEQLAAMLGYSVDEQREPCAWGHLTSGGTVANYEALWNFRSLKFYPLALRAGAAATGHDVPEIGPAGKALSEYSDWELANFTIDQTVALRREVARRLEGASRREVHEFSRAVRTERIESLGTAAFFARHSELSPPVVLAAASAHYSWSKAMKVLGLGTSSLLAVAVDDHMRLDAGHLEETLARSLEAEVPVLAAVGMLGTTEFGTVDPIHEIVAARRRWRARGCDFGIHVDGAWGGYLASVFRRPDGAWAEREEVAEGFRYFPSEVLYRAFRAVPEADSVTVDPHKLGYVTYPAGAFIARNREVVDFISQEAAYVFDVDAFEADRVARRETLADLGRYVLEGSKPGAAAAAVHVAHRVLPLHREGMGRLLAWTVRACERFWEAAGRMRERLEGRVRLSVPFEPDSNLICIALNPTGNVAVAVANRFARRVFGHMRVDPDRPVQMRAFIGSHTSLLKESLPGEQADRILAELGLDPDTFRIVPEDDAREADHLFILRHTLMNPWLLTGPGHRSYVDLYWEWLEGVLEEELAAG